MFARWWNWALTSTARRAVNRRCGAPLVAVTWTPSNCSSNSARTCTPATLSTTPRRWAPQTTRAIGTSLSICFSSRRSATPSSTEDSIESARCCVRILSACASETKTDALPCTTRTGTRSTATRSSSFSSPTAPTQRQGQRRPHSRRPDAAKGPPGSGRGFAPARWRLGMSGAVRSHGTHVRAVTSAIATWFRRERGDEI